MSSIFHFLTRKLFSNNYLKNHFIHRHISPFPRLQRYTPFKNNFLLYSLFTAVGTYAYIKYKSKSPLHCCGVIGYLGKEKNAVPTCGEGIQILQFRGYDSCGGCTINSKGDFQLTKYASDIANKTEQGDCIQRIVENAPQLHEPSFIGIGHTRWATHGKKIPGNSHPHLDNSGKIAGVHNGIVDNYRELLKFLESKNIHCKSETDTEVIAQIIGMYYNQGGSFKESVSKTLNEHIIGSYALIIINKEHPEEVIVARNGSPLGVGIGKDFFIISSDVCAFQKYTNNYINIDSSKIGEGNLNMKISTDIIKTSISENIFLKPLEGYQHFMLQEIYEQPDTINRAMNYGSRFKPISNELCNVKLGGLEQYKDFLKNGKNLVIIACGTSMHAGMFVSNLMRKGDIFNTIQIVDGADFTENYIPKDNPIIIFVSQSGETFDIIKSLEICKKHGIICLGIVNKVESTGARSVLCGVFINAGREISVASTKAFTGQVISLLLTTLFFSQTKHETSFLNPGFTNTISFLKGGSSSLENDLKYYEENAIKISKVGVKYHSVFVIGKGFSESICKEIALKIKEVSYIHAEAYNAGAFKHGPGAMIDSDLRTPVIIIVAQDECYDDMLTSFNQIKARNAMIVLLTNCKDKIDVNGIDFIIEFPNHGGLSCLYSVFIGQLLAYYCSVVNGFNPDKPRQLSKEITTK